MKTYLSLIILTILLIACNENQLGKKELVSAYYEAFDDSDFNKLLPLITDSLTITEGEYVTPYSKASFYQQFKWDSVFQTTYEIVSLVEENEQVIASVASRSIRYAFLKNDPLTCTFKISFEEDKIAKLEAMDCVDADWNIWQTERDSLVNWIKINHPYLDGFIHDLSMQGAINYVNAIELYQNKETSL